MTPLIRYFIKNKLFSWLSIVFIFLAGLMGLFSLQRDSLPNVDIKQVVISTTFPGASPEDVELRITYPIEEKLKEVDGIDELRSVSRNSVSDIDVRIDLDDKDPDKVIEEIRRAVDSVQNFPPQVTDKPRITERKSSSYPIYDFSIYGGKDENELQEYAIYIQDEIRKISGVARVDIFGKRDHEWHVLANFDEIKRRNLDIMDIVQSVSGRSINLPAGSLENEESKDIRIDGEFKKIEDIYKLPIRTNEALNHIRIGDVAIVKDTYAIPKFLAISNGQPGLIFSVVKKERSDAISTVDDVKERIEELKINKPENINFFELNDEAARTKNRLNVVINNAIIGFTIVFAILFLFMDTRTAILTSISLPLALLGTFMFLPSMNITFNLISMMGIIIGLGMLVDNSIVISDNIYTYIRQGMSKLDAAVKGSSEMVIPIFGSYLTTVAAFVPMLSMSGVMGKFIYQIPLVVIIALSASLVESFFLLPSRLYLFSNDLKEINEKSKFRRSLNSFYDKMDEKFSNFVAFLLKFKKISFISILLILGFTFFALSKMKFILFPKENIEIILVKVEFNPAVRATETREKMKPIEKIIQKIPKSELVSYSIKIGVQQTDPDDPLSRYGEQLAIVTIFLTPEVERERLASEILSSIEPDLKKIEGIESLFIEELAPAPPIGAAITLSVLGDKYDELQKISKEIKDYMGTINGVINIRDDYKYGRQQMIVNLDHNLEILTGVNTFNASEVIRTAYDGNKVSTLRKGKDKIYIRVLYDEDFRKSPDKISEIPIRNKYDGITILSSIANVTQKDAPELLTHR
ncbi:MAG: efflux RND transporter permease subunit, partial [Leptospiraceae bacterium]|nr:efflux RND transporter permease subunit [Leptospiraceae bacterium]